MASLLFRTLAAVLVAASLVEATVTPGHAQSDTPEARFISSLGERAIYLLSAETLTAEQRTAGFSELLSSGFALDDIGRFVLGRYWKSASEAQRRSYLPLFRQYVISTYASRLQGYAGETFTIVGQRHAGAKDVIVRTRIARPGGGTLIDADWRIRKFEGQFRIIDVMVEGISMAITQRQEFSSVVRRQGMTGLIAELSARTAGVAEAGFQN
ncbi:MAG: MlaC/ttg2D family ABC transporter substrate-binding protein [Alphaproteobacteria bacterium]